MKRTANSSQGLTDVEADITCGNEKQDHVKIIKKNKRKRQH